MIVVRKPTIFNHWELYIAPGKQDEECGEKSVAWRGYNKRGVYFKSKVCDG